MLIQKRFQFFFVAITAILIGSSAFAENDKSDPVSASIEVSEVWAPASFPAAKTAAVYLTLKNVSDVDVSLVSASLDESIASMVQIHHTMMHGDMAKMHELKDGLTIPANSIVTMKPRGLHIMLMGLKAPLKTKQTFMIDLNFSDGTSQTHEVLIKDTRS